MDEKGMGISRILKNIPALFGGGIVLIATIWLVMSLYELMPRKADYSDEDIVDGDLFSYEISELRIGGTTSQLDGWIIKNGLSTKNIKLKIYAVVKQSDGSWLKLPTSIVKRKDITKLMDDGNDYSWSGIIVRWLNMALSPEEFEKSELYINYEVDGEDMLIPVKETD